MDETIDGSGEATSPQHGHRVPEAYRGDYDLVQGTLAGDTRARHTLGARLSCIEPFVRTIHRRCGRELAADECQDLVQDVRVRVLESLNQFRGASKLETWVYQFCRGRVLNRIRDEGRRGRTESLEAEPAARAEVMFELAEEYSRALERLGPPDDAIIRLRIFEELEFAAIGRSLELHTSTVKTRYRRALQRLALLLPSLKGGSR